MSAPAPSNKDGQQVLKYAFDDATGRLRTDAVISPDGHDLEIHYQDDSIAIGDPTTDTIMTVNPDGSTNVRMSNTLITEPFDYISVGYPSSTVETYTYKMGGAGGSLIGVVTVSYVDATKNQLLSVAKS